MDHYRQRKYRGPETWARVREAYVAGESGPSVARRFDVGLANLRKKAMREGWTRTSVAQALDRELPPRREPPAPWGPPGTDPMPPVPSLVDGLPDALAIQAVIGTRNVTVMEAITFAASRVSALLAEGRAAEANVHITALANLAKLTGLSTDPKHQAVLRRMLLQSDETEPPKPRQSPSEAHHARNMAILARTAPGTGWKPGD